MAFVNVVLLSIIVGEFIFSSLKKKSLSPTFTSKIPPTAIGKSSEYIVFIGTNLSNPSTFKIIS